MDKKTFPEFLEKSYVDWQSKEGKRTNLEEFANYLGISRPLLSMWLLGKRRPGPESIKNLAEKLGSEVYIALGINNDPILTEIQNQWEFLNDKEKERIWNIIKKAESSEDGNGTNTSSAKPRASNTTP